MGGWGGELRCLNLFQRAGERKHFRFAAQKRSDGRAGRRCGRAAGGTHDADGRAGGRENWRWFPLSQLCVAQRPRKLLASLLRSTDARHHVKVVCFRRALNHASELFALVLWRLSRTLHTTQID